MSTYTRPAKTVSGGGGTSVVDGNKWPASEINADFDGLVNLVNGNLDETNISSSAQIANTQLAEIAVTKVSDYSSNAAAHLTTVAAGSTGTILAGSTTLPTDLSDELERLRYRFLAGNHLLSAQFIDSAGSAQTIGWVEAPIVGPQLLQNNGFEVKTSGTAGAAPDGWTLVGTPTSLVVTAAAEKSVGLYKRSLVITSAAANDGISQVVSGLKASTKYLIGLAYVRTSATVSIQTSGGLGSGDYQNITSAMAVSSGTSIAYMQAVVQTTTNADPITVSLLNTLAGGAKVFAAYQMWMYELRDQTPIGLPHIPMQTATISAASTGMTGYSTSGNVYRTDTLSSLTLAQYCPAPGYRFTYEVSVPVQSKTSTKEVWIVYGKIQLNTGGGAADAVGPVIYSSDAVSSNGQYSATFNLKHVVENPTPGTTYTFSFVLGSYDSTTSPDTIYAPSYPAAGGVQTKATARLFVERI